MDMIVEVNLVTFLYAIVGGFFFGMMIAILIFTEAMEKELQRTKKENEHGS